jgi:hypothetical protein
LLVATSVAAALDPLGHSGWTFSSPPVRYQVLYENRINGVPQWEVLAANRPFDGSDLTYLSATRPTPESVADTGSVSTATALYAVDAGGVRLVSARQPGPASEDLWLAPEIADATRRGLARDMHRTRRLADTRCRVFRFADPPSGPLHALGAANHDDLCIARNGLVLSEEWTYNGSVVEQRTAADVWIGAGWPTSMPRPPSIADASAASAAAAVVTPDPQPTSDLAAPTPPPGYQAYGLPLQFRLPDPQQPSSTVAATVIWTYTDGPRVVTIETGMERGGHLPWTSADTVTRAVHLPALGAASTALRSDGPEVRIVLGDGRWARVRGTVPLSLLIRFAATLRTARG